MVPVSPVVVTVVVVPSANVCTLPVTVVVPLVAVPATPAGHLTVKVPNCVIVTVVLAAGVNLVNFADPVTLV
jgi:hypothetical protein